MLPKSHRLLARQLEKLQLSSQARPATDAEWHAFLERVGQSYQDLEEDRYLLERSLEISADEMKQRFHKINLLVDQLQCNQAVMSGLLQDLPIETIMTDLALEIEKRLVGFKCAIFSVKSDDGSLSFLSGPSLPNSIIDLIKCGQVPPTQCPCHAAMKTRELVSIFSDLKSSSDLFAKLGIGVCHALPVLDDANVVVAVFALYASDPLPLENDQADLMRSLGSVLQMTLSFLEIKETLHRENMASIARSKLETLGELAGGVAHEINNPLFILQGYVDVVRAAIEDQQIDPKDLTEICDSMATNINRISKIVKTLRTFSRDGAHDPLEPSRVATLISDAMELCSKRYDGVRFDVQMDPKEAEAVVLCRPVEIVQVVINLLNNAYYAVKDRPDPWIRLNVKREGPSLEIRVTDSGSGIEPNVANKLFQPFVTTKPVGEGTGLGLSISKRIVESHSGRLYYNPAHRNTQFVMQLPLTPAEAA